MSRSYYSKVAQVTDADNESLNKESELPGSSLDSFPPKSGFGGTWIIVFVVSIIGLGYFLYSRKPKTDPSTLPNVDAIIEKTQSVFERALTLVEHGQQKEFREAVEELRDLPGTAEHLNLLLGISLTFSGDNEAALARISKVPPVGNLRKPMMKWSAECLVRLGRHGDAEQILKSLIAESPKDPDGHRRIARVYHQLGAMDFAIAALKETAKYDPDDFWAYRMSGLIYNADYANFTAAIEQYRLALERTVPESEERAIRTELAECLIQQRDYAAALDVLKPVPNAVQTLVMRSECLWSTGELEPARELLAEAAAINADATVIKVLKARMLLDDGEREHAIELLTSILEKEPHDFQTRYQLALAYQAIGDSAAYDREMAAYRESESLRNGLFDLYREAMKDPSNADIRDEIASQCEKLGQTDLAETWRRAAKSARQHSSEAPQTNR